MPIELTEDALTPHSAALPLAIPQLDRASPVSLQAQLYAEMRGAILAGRLGIGARLPPTRLLAADLGVARNTVAGAFDRLVAEGYLEARVGDGTYVARALPEELLHARPLAAVPATPRPSALQLSRRGALLAADGVSAQATPAAMRAFRPVTPALDAFPRRTWARLLDRHARRTDTALLDHGDPAGHAPLREAIAAYLGAARGVRCTAEQIIIVGGSQQALDLAARMLLDPGDAAALEDPGYGGAQRALRGAEARLIPVPVDAEGLDPGPDEVRLAGARLVYVTPSHQFPLGATMGLGRRLRLLDWARRTGGWVLEDDYDGEYRYAGQPLPALQGLNGGERVVYFGTFSKVLFPGLRLGYLVAPSDLAATFAAARRTVDGGSPRLEQAALADFIAEGHFGRHVRRTRLLYAERQRALVAALQRGLGGLVEAREGEAGMHLVGWLPPGTDDVAVARRARALGVVAPALSAHALGKPSPPGLVLGFAGVDEAEMAEGAQRLRRAAAGVG